MKYQFKDLVRKMQKMVSKPRREFVVDIPAGETQSFQAKYFEYRLTPLNDAGIVTNPPSGWADAASLIASDNPDFDGYSESGLMENGVISAEALEYYKIMVSDLHESLAAIRIRVVMPRQQWTQDLTDRELAEIEKRENAHVASLPAAALDSKISDILSHAASLIVLRMSHQMQILDTWKILQIHRKVVKTPADIALRNKILSRMGWVQAVVLHSTALKSQAQAIFDAGGDPKSVAQAINDIDHTAGWPEWDDAWN